MGFIVGLFLMYMSEEESFWMLERVMRSDKFLMHGVYAIGFPLLHQYFYQFDQLLNSTQPKLHEHLDMHGITPTLYATQWFITIFSYNVITQHTHRHTHTHTHTHTHIYLTHTLPLPNQPR